MCVCVLNSGQKADIIRQFLLSEYRWKFHQTQYNSRDLHQESEIKKVVCASYLKQHSGSDKSLCRSLTLFYSGSEIHCVMFSFWRLLEAFGKLKQMGNREGTFCRAGVPSAVPPTAVASVTRHYRGFLSTLWRPAVVTLRNCT